MIAGMIQIEDHTIHFRLVDGEMEFTACDGHTGRQYGMRCNPRHFYSAMLLSLHDDPDCLPEEMWTAAELVQPPNDDSALRWIP